MAVTGWKWWLFTIDHKKIRIMYGAGALFCFVAGGIEALLIRLQLAQPDGKSELAGVTGMDAPDRTRRTAKLRSLSLATLSKRYSPQVTPDTVGCRRRRPVEVPSLRPNPGEEVS